MIGPFAWPALAVCVVAVAVVCVWQRSRIAQLNESLRRAERRVTLLGDLAPPLTEAAHESTPLTCERIVERFCTLVVAQVALVFVDQDGRMVLRSRSDSEHATFLRTGEVYEAEGILAWAQRNHCAAIVGPSQASIPTGVPIVDLGTQRQGRAYGPIVGSRDRVWALCIPMMLQRGYGLRPAVIGAVYAERAHDTPFAHEDIRTAMTTARLAADALQRARFADEVKREAQVDQLTQMLSAATFRKRLREVIEGRHRDVALFFIDTDRFKLWNDTFGHAVGDALLKGLAGIFQEVAASGGFAGRNGGDEFCIALLDRTKDDAIAVAERLRERIERTEFVPGPAVVPQPRIPITISVGVAHYPVDVPSTADGPADRLLEAADARMYEAKREGRNKVAYARARLLPSTHNS